MSLQSNYTEFNTPQFRKLSPDQVERLHHARVAQAHADLRLLEQPVVVARVELALEHHEARRAARQPRQAHAPGAELRQGLVGPDLHARRLCAPAPPVDPSADCETLVRLAPHGRGIATRSPRRAYQRSPRRDSGRIACGDADRGAPGAPASSSASSMKKWATSATSRLTASLRP